MNKKEKRKYVFAQLNSLPNAFQYVEVTNYIKNLEKENQKYKEVINKLKQFCDNDDNFWILDAYSQDDVYSIQGKLLDILKEVNYE